MNLRMTNPLPVVEVSVTFLQSQTSRQYRISSSNPDEIQGLLGTIWRHLADVDRQLQIMIGSRTLLVYEARTLRDDPAIVNFFKEEIERVQSLRGYDVRVEDSTEGLRTTITRSPGEMLWGDRLSRAAQSMSDTISSPDGFVPINPKWPVQL